jgi:hypothetical protein
MSNGYLSAKETAKLVRQALRESFPSVKFSVRAENFANGCAVNVTWLNGPELALVKAVAEPFNRAAVTIAGKEFNTLASVWVNHENGCPFR